MTGTVRRFVPQPILIPAGTIITCENGRRVCTTAVDLHVNALLTAEMFTAWEIAAPRAGDMFPRCGVCGAAAHRESRDGVTLHTPDGWR